MNRDPIEATKPRHLECISADIPADLRHADDLLTRYGRWAVTSSRGGGAYTLERMYVPEKERSARYALDNRREAAYGKATREALLPVLEAMTIQRLLARLPDRERIVLAALYVPRRIPATAQLQILGITPDHSRRLHISGLRRFATFLAMQMGVR